MDNLKNGGGGDGGGTILFIWFEDTASDLHFWKAVWLQGGEGVCVGRKVVGRPVLRPVQWSGRGGLGRGLGCRQKRWQEAMKTTCVRVENGVCKNWVWGVRGKEKARNPLGFLAFFCLDGQLFLEMGAWRPRGMGRDSEFAFELFEFRCV